jgi:hypothetical protein
VGATASEQELASAMKNLKQESLDASFSSTEQTGTDECEDPTDLERKQTHCGDTEVCKLASGEV